MPLDAYHSRDRERYARALELASDIGCNMLRVWGGGVIEDELFYNMCDRMGFMVWQEFIQSSSGVDNIPSKRPEFLVRAHATAEYATKTLRNQMIKSNLKTCIKKFDELVANADAKGAQEALKLTFKRIDQAVAKGVIHKNAAARKKAQISLKLNSIA